MTYCQESKCINSNITININMKKITTTQILVLAILFIAVPVAIIASTFNWNVNDSKSFTIKNNSTRNYKYEHYCDSMYYTNQDYYLDVIVETEEFQNYIYEHGEWWTN